jgi:hypothetical protein
VSVSFLSGGESESAHQGSSVVAAAAPKKSEASPSFRNQACLLRLMERQSKAGVEILAQKRSQ